MLTIVTGFGIIPATSVAVAPPVAVPEPADVAVVMIDMPEHLREMADWAVDLFGQADLDLPRLRFIHHGGLVEPCQGRAGLHHVVDDMSVIEICATEADRATRVMILHETAHAWAAHGLTPERKSDFRELRGWTYWRDYDAAPWHENGTEQAAEIMVWGLIDEPLGMIRIYQTTCADLEAGYRALTGSAPLNGLRDLC